MITKELRELAIQIDKSNSLEEAKSILLNHQELLDLLNQKYMNKCEINSELNELYKLVDDFSDRSLENIKQQVLSLHMAISLGDY